MNARTGLTERQKETFDAIVAFQQTHGRAPSVRELAGAIGGAISVTQWLINQLRDRGHITRIAGRRCSIVVVDDPHAPQSSLPPRTQALLDAYCRLHGEEPQAVIADAVAIFLDQREADIAAEHTVQLHPAPLS